MPTMHPTPAMQDLIDGFFAKNRALWGDLRMEADLSDGATDGEQAEVDAAQDQQPKPTETVDFWKQKAREQERRAKANADAAKELSDIKEAQKTEEQKRAEAVAQQQRENENLRLENLRLRVAAEHAVSGEDTDAGVQYADLIAGTDEETVRRNAKALGSLVAAKRELDALKTGRPVSRIASLTSGATGRSIAPSANGENGRAEALRRYGKPTP